MPTSSVDLGRYRWRKVTGEPGGALKVHHDYTILGWDLAAGTLFGGGTNEIQRDIIAMAGMGMPHYRY
jgi:hypothetical protein